jgi:hypothetical protein
MSKIFLGTIQTTFLKPNEPEKRHSINLAVELSEDEFKKVSGAIAVINNFMQDSQIFMIATWNFAEFIELIDSYILAYINKDANYFEQKPIDININRTFLNLLSSLRSYLDFMERLLKKRYGNNSNIFKNFKKNSSLEYDNNFSYRFLFNLRHYAQHKGFPIGSISLGQKPNKNNPQKTEYFLNIRFVRDQLLQEFDWRNLEDDIKKLPEKIEVMPYIISFIESVKKIHVQTIIEMCVTLSDSAALILNNVKKLGNNEGTIAVFEADDINEMKNLKHTLVPVNLCQKIVEGKLSEIFSNINDKEIQVTSI